MYKSEKEFLKNYDSNEFQKISLTSDILIFSVSDEDDENYRKLSKKELSVLLMKRRDYPFKDMWCLPGGFMKIDETSEQAANRILESETNLKNIYLEQLYSFDDVLRDPRMRIVTTSYMALIDKKRLKDQLYSEASWFNVNYEETEKEFNVVLDNEEEEIKFSVTKKLRKGSTDRYDFLIKENDKLAFDHPLVIVTGIARLKNKAEYTDIIFNMMPKYFTLGELQQVYEIVLGKKLLDPAFRRIIAHKVLKTDEFKTGGGHRPAALFTYKNK